MAAPKNSEAVLLDKSATVIFLYRLSKLKLWPDNYHKGDVDLIVRSVQKFGFNGALRIWKGDEVRGGNHAKLALEQMRAAGLEAPRGIEVDGDEWLVPGIDISHLNEAEAIAYAIADNETAKAGSDSDDKLAHLLSTIKAQNAGLLGAIGVSNERTESLLARLKATATSAEDLLNQAKVQSTQQEQSTTDGDGTTPETVDALSTSEGDRGKTPEERLETYNTTSVRQIVLYFNSTNYLGIVNDLKAIREYFEVESNTEAVEKLIEEHKRNVA